MGYETKLSYVSEEDISSKKVVIVPPSERVPSYDSISDAEDMAAVKPLKGNPRSQANDQSSKQMVTNSFLNFV